jgi:hypothetical protein
LKTKYVFALLLALACQKTVMAQSVDGQAGGDGAHGDVAVMIKTGSGIFGALTPFWRPIIRRPQTTPPAPQPAQPLPSPRPTPSGTTSGRPAYPSYLPGSDYPSRS